MHSHSGFSIIEILLAMGILSILMAISSSVFIGYRNTVEAEEEISHIRSLLRSAQGKAIAFEENSQWGVHFSNPLVGNPTYELFAGSAYPGTIKETIFLSSRYMFVSPASGSTQDVIFEKRSGRSTSASTITITIKPRSGETPVKSADVTREGIIQ